MIRPYPPISSVHSYSMNYFDECTITRRRPYYSGIPTHQSSQPSQVLLDTNKHCKEQANEQLIQHSEVKPTYFQYQNRKLQTKTMIPKFSYEINQEQDKRSKSNVITNVKQNSRFKALGNLIRSVKRLQQTIVKKISSINQLNEYISPISTKQSKVYPQTNWESIGEITYNLKLINQFVNHAQSGSLDDIKQMQLILYMDPKKHLRSTNDPENLINQHNKFGQNALYVACKNGNLNVIKFLHTIKCNPFIKSKVNEKLEESCLEAAIRWNHVQCVKFMIDNNEYQNDVLKKAVSIAENREICHLIKTRLQKSSLFNCCFI